MGADLIANFVKKDVFGVTCIPKELKKLIENKNITTNIYRIQGNDWIMSGKVKSKIFLDYANLFSPIKFEKNDKIILHYFQ